VFPASVAQQHASHRCCFFFCTRIVLQRYKIFPNVALKAGTIRQKLRLQHLALINPAQVTSAQFGQMVLLLKLKIS